MRGASTATAAAVANAVIAWPEGNDGEPGTPTSASKPIASGGRARATRSLRKKFTAEATKKLAVAASAINGTSRRPRRSAHQPTATSSGPLTHHAETSARIAVAGSQRRSEVTRIASRSRSISS